MKKHPIISKILLAVFLIGSISHTGHAQLLWKISGNHLKKTSYLLGTNHFVPLTFCDTLSGFEKAFRASKQFFGEVSFVDSANTKAFSDIPKMQILPDNQTLSDFYTPEEYEEVLQYVESFLGTRPGMITFTPGALFIFLTMTYPKIQSGIEAEYLDDGLERRAQKEGKKVGGLEAAELGVNLLWGGDIEQDAAQLLDAIRDPANSKDSLASSRLRIDNAYYSQDLDLLFSMLKQGLDGEKYQDLVSKRNLSWLPVMEESMKKCCTFFAVGAGHLPGDEGVIELLRKQGYTVEPVSGK